MKDIKWTISRTGDLECRATGYYITRDRLAEQDWVSHMTEKMWVNDDEFITAYKLACRAAGIKEVPQGYDGRRISIDKL